MPSLDLDIKADLLGNANETLQRHLKCLDDKVQLRLKASTSPIKEMLASFYYSRHLEHLKNLTGDVSSKSLPE